MTESESNSMMRRVRSFVIREGRMTKGQQRAMDEVFPKIGIPFSKEQIDLTKAFSVERPIVLEIGFGMGKSLATQAKNNPDLNYIGIEVHRPGVGACLVLADEYNLDNLRVINHDAVEVIEHMVADNSLAGIQIFFPDPWHKKRHHKRRIIQPNFIDKIKAKLAVGSFLHLATDWQNYAEYMLEVMQSAEGWQNLSPNNNYIERPDSRPITKFETRGVKLGHGVWDLMFERIA